ncbi:NUDIX domain-containing protein [Thermodesulfobacteriota bacterium]
MQKTRPQCGLIIENAHGEILLQLRDDNPQLQYPNCWGTFGGQVEAGETPEEAIRREIREELDYAVAEPAMYGIYPFEGYDIYMFRVVDSAVKLDDLNVNEGQCGRFFARDEIRDILCAFNCREIVEDYFKRFL